jgi:hypothetical protein
VRDKELKLEDGEASHTHVLSEWGALKVRVNGQTFQLVQTVGRGIIYIYIYSWRTNKC